MIPWFVALGLGALALLSPAQGPPPSTSTSSRPGGSAPLRNGQDPRRPNRREVLRKTANGYRAEEP